jgi:hypothetical protein
VLGTAPGWPPATSPGKGTVYDYYVSPKTAKFTPWAELVSDVAYNSASTPMGAVFVPTPETASLRFFLDIMVGSGAPGIGTEDRGSRGKLDRAWKWVVQYADCMLPAGSKACRLG